MVEHILLMVECAFVLCATFALVIKAKHYERNSNHRKGIELHHGERR